MPDCRERKYFHTVKDMYTRFKDLVEDGYGDYPVSFDIGEDEPFYEYDGGFYINSHVNIQLCPEEE